MSSTASLAPSVSRRLIALFGNVVLSNVSVANGEITIVTATTELSLKGVDLPDGTYTVDLKNEDEIVVTKLADEPVAKKTIKSNKAAGGETSTVRKSGSSSFSAAAMAPARL